MNLVVNIVEKQRKHVDHQHKELIY